MSIYSGLGLGLLLLASSAQAQLGTGHQVADSGLAGPAYPWEGQAGGVNLGNGNLMTSVPIVSWTAKGGLPVALTFYNDSEGAHNSELGTRWTHSLDIWGTNVLSGYLLFHMPDDSQLVRDGKMIGEKRTKYRALSRQF